MCRYFSKLAEKITQSTAKTLYTVYRQRVIHTLWYKRSEICKDKDQVFFDSGAISNQNDLYMRHSLLKKSIVMNTCIMQFENMAQVQTLLSKGVS